MFIGLCLCKENTSSASDSSFYTGSISLAIRDTGDEPILSQVGGGAFDLLAIDLDNGFGASGIVNFVGTLSGGGIVSTTFNDFAMPYLWESIFRGKFC